MIVKQSPIDVAYDTPGAWPEFETIQPWAEGFSVSAARRYDDTWSVSVHDTQFNLYYFGYGNSFEEAEFRAYQDFHYDTLLSGGFYE